MRLFFHLFNGTDQIVDEEGVEVGSLDDAHGVIIDDIKELAREFRTENWQGWVLNVTDRSGTTLFSILLDRHIH
jgi:hypothetical protein